MLRSFDPAAAPVIAGEDAGDAFTGLAGTTTGAGAAAFAATGDDGGATVAAATVRESLTGRIFAGDP
jgi:hypothetical protein